MRKITTTYWILLLIVITGFVIAAPGLGEERPTKEEQRDCEDDKEKETLNETANCKRDKRAWHEYHRDLEYCDMKEYHKEAFNTTPFYREENYYSKADQQLCEELRRNPPPTNCEEEETDLSARKEEEKKDCANSRPSSGLGTGR